jgi:hypothetical protein
MKPRVLTTSHFDTRAQIPMWYFTKGARIILRGFRSIVNRPFPVKLRILAKEGANAFAPFEVEIPCAKDRKNYLIHDLNIVIDTASTPFGLLIVDTNTQDSFADFQILYDQLDGSDIVSSVKPIYRLTA